MNRGSLTMAPGDLDCDIEHLSLHAKVLIAAANRDELERLCRYIARPRAQSSVYRSMPTVA